MLPINTPGHGDGIQVQNFPVYARLMYCRRCGSAMAVQGSSSRDFNAEYPGDDTEIEISVMDRSLPSAKDDEED